MSHIAAAYARVAESSAAPVLSADTKRRAVAALAQAIQQSGSERKRLADDLGMSKAHFSRLEHGDGDLLGFVDRLPPAIGDVFMELFAGQAASADAADGVLDSLNAVDLDRIAVLWLRLRKLMPQPAKASNR